MVQIPEKLDPDSVSDPTEKQIIKNGIEFLTALNKPTTLSELGKERIRRAAKKIKEETGADIDYGFRVYRLDSSNMQDVYYKPQDYEQDNLELFADNVKPDRTADDLLAQVMLDWGLPLSLSIEQVEIAGKTVYKVAGDSLYACFDSGIDEDFTKAIAKAAPLRIVFRDSGFKHDTAKVNVRQLLKQLSPDTEMKVL
jgi:adenine-specific DNA-methyltransferase